MRSSARGRGRLLLLLLLAAAVAAGAPAAPAVAEVATCKAWLVQSIPTDMPHLRRVPGVLSTGNHSSLPFSPPIAWARSCSWWGEARRIGAVWIGDLGFLAMPIWGLGAKCWNVLQRCKSLVFCLVCSSSSSTLWIGSILVWDILKYGTISFWAAHLIMLV